MGAYLIQICLFRLARWELRLPIDIALRGRDRAKELNSARSAGYSLRGRNRQMQRIGKPTNDRRRDCDYFVALVLVGDVP